VVVKKEPYLQDLRVDVNVDEDHSNIYHIVVLICVFIIFQVSIKGGCWK